MLTVRANLVWISIREPNVRRLSAKLSLEHCPIVCVVGLNFIFALKPMGLATCPLEYILSLNFISALTYIKELTQVTPLRVRGRFTRSHSAYYLFALF